METKYLNIHQHLIDRCLEGDKEAQFEIYKQYYRSMYNTSLRIVGRSEDAEDIMQEAFLTVFQKLESYQGNVSFGSWMKRIVINRSLDYLRKRKVQFEEVADDLPLTDDEQTDSCDWSLEDIKYSINQLSDGYRTVLSLILIEGYTHEEASQLMGTSNVNSRTQFCRAKQRLRELLIEKSSKKIMINKLWMN